MVEQLSCHENSCSDLKAYYKVTVVVNDIFLLLVET